MNLVRGDRKKRLPTDARDMCKAERYPVLSRFSGRVKRSDAADRRVHPPLPGRAFTHRHVQA